MKPLAACLDGRLRWIQPALFARAYDLRHGDDIAGTLVFRSTFGSFATGQTAEGRWTFKRVGFWHPQATVRVEGATSDLAVFEHSTWRGGGTLRLSGGRSIRVTTNLWQSKIEFQLAEDRVLFRYLTDGFLRQQSDLQVLPPLQAMPELPWLLLFGWYLVVMMHEDNATHVAIVA
jgi:hypothetical protein